jgi:phage shock protein A
MFQRFANLIRGFFNGIASGFEKRNPELLLENAKEDLRKNVIAMRNGRAQLAAQSASLQRQVAEGKIRERELEGRVQVFLDAGKDEQAGDAALELQTIKDDLTKNNDQLAQNESAYKEFTAMCATTEKELMRKIQEYGRMISEAKAKEAAAEAAEFISGTISSTAGSGDNLDRLKTVVTERLDHASGRLRAAQDTSGFSNVKAMQEERQLRASAALASFKAAKGMKAGAPATPAVPEKVDAAKPPMSAPSESA